MSEKFTVNLSWPVIEMPEPDYPSISEKKTKYHSITTPGGRIIYSNPAPMFGGSDKVLNPEEMLISALSSCQFMTFLAIAEKARLDLVSYEDSAELYLNDDKVKFAEKVVLNIKMKFGTPQDKNKIYELCEKAHKYCIIGNSLKSDFQLNLELLD